MVWSSGQVNNKAGDDAQRTTPAREQILRSREQLVAQRETAVRIRERALGEHEEILSEREEIARLQEDASRARNEAEHATMERERLMVQMRAANEQLLLTTLRADEMTEEAEASRVIVVESARVATEGRERAEALATQLLASQAALYASEIQFRVLADTVPMLAWYAESDGTIAWYNQRWFEYTGATVDEQVEGKWDSVLDPEHFPRILAGWTAAIASGQPLSLIHI